MTEEIWKPVSGFEGFYEVSNLGNVRSINREIETRDAWGGTAVKKLRGRMLSPLRYPNGYLGARLCKGGDVEIRLVHRLVATEFIGSGHDLQVNHVNANRADNRVQNLEWVTCSENHRHAHSLPHRKLNARAIQVAAALDEGPAVFESLKAFVRHLSASRGVTRSAGSVFSAIRKNHLCAGVPVWEVSCV